MLHEPPLLETAHAGRLFSRYRLAAQVFSVAQIMLLGRLLGPAAFGQFDMVLAVVVLLQALTVNGIDIHLVQEPELSPPQIDNHFWLMQWLGFAAGGALATVAAVLACLPAQRELAAVMAGTAGVLPLTALATVHLSLLQRRLELAAVGRLRLVAQAWAFLFAALCAALGAGVWALVVQQYVEWIVLARWSWRAEPWRPAAPRWQVDWSAFGFGSYYTLSQFVFNAAASIDKLLIGIAAGAVALGLYGRAYQWMMKPIGLVVTTVTAILLPALARHRLAPARQQRLVLGFYRVLGLALLPSAAVLAIAAPELTWVINGPLFREAGPVLAILALGLPARGLMDVFGTILLSRGKSAALLGWAIYTLVAVTAGVVTGLGIGSAYHARLEGAAWGLVAAMWLLLLPPYLPHILREIGLPWRNWVASLRSGARTALGVAAAMLPARWLMRQLFPEQPFVVLAVELGMGGLAALVLTLDDLRWFVLGRR